MQRESFTDPLVAKLINDNFIAILVDREEMPNLDASFQLAAALLDLRTGWPLNMFLTSNGEPYWGGTYFPRNEIMGMATFPFVLEKMSVVYREQPKAVRNNAASIINALQRMAKTRPGTIGIQQIDNAARSFAGQINPFDGGFGEPPLFPMTIALKQLWRAHIRNGGNEFGDSVTDTLSSMINGGIYDHVGGGYFRYVIDAEWKIPHYEKMLDVNANLLGLMVEVWRETKDKRLANRIRGTVAFLLDEMRLDGGAFASALDADSVLVEGGTEEEGAYYTFEPETIEHVLGSDSGTFFGAYELASYDGGPGIFYRNDTKLGELAATLGTDEAAVDKKLRASLLKLRSHRAHRPYPRRDNKILADWNAIAINALTEAAMAFGKDDWLAAAEQAFGFIEATLVANDGRLHHSWTPGGDGRNLGGPAAIDDLGGMASAALTLYEATGKEAYLSRARSLVDQTITHHWDKAEGGFFATIVDAGPLLVRAKPIHDNPNMSGNSRMLEVLARLYYLTGEERLVKLADRTMKLFGGHTEDPSLSIAGLLNSSETLLTALQIVVIGERGKAATDALIQQVNRTALPNRVLQVISPGTSLPDSHPALNKEQIDGQPTAYVCKGTFCSLPATGDDLSYSLKTLRHGGS
jgi:uncharacterized protein